MKRAGERQREISMQYLAAVQLNKIFLPLKYRKHYDDNTPSPTNPKTTTTIQEDAEFSGKEDEGHDANTRTSQNLINKSKPNTLRYPLHLFVSSMLSKNEKKNRPKSIKT
jgi:hypothetical protein